MLRRTCSSLAFTLLALGLAISTRPMPGQTISFFRQFSTPEMDRATAVAADASGIYVIGSRGVRKYDSRGNGLWTRGFSVPALESATLVRAAANATGVYVVGWTNGETNRFVRKYGAGGDELWTRQLEFLPTGLGVDDTGVYVAGAIFAPFPDRGNLLRKYNAEGAELWTSRFQDPALSPYYGVVAVDATGVYVFGPSSAGKWDPRGNQLWTRQLGTTGLVAAAAPAGFYVVGGRGGSPFLRRYDAGGNELWTRQLATSSTGLYPGGVAADASGVYVAGTTDRAGPALPGQCRSGSGVDSFVLGGGAVDQCCGWIPSLVPDIRSREQGRLRHPGRNRRGDCQRAARPVDTQPEATASEAIYG